MAPDDGAPRRPPTDRTDPVHKRVLDFDVTTADEEVPRGIARWSPALLLLGLGVLIAAVWWVGQIPLEDVPIPSPQLPPGAEDVGHPLEGL